MMQLNRMTRLLRSAIFSTCLFLPAYPLLATELPKGVSQHSTVEGITEYRLQNGLKILLIPDASKPTVAVNITYLVGSRQENYGETGMAHLLEHMLFKGTPKHPKIDVDFNQRGMRSNGSTTLDRTNYYEIFQSSDDNLKWALDMEADRMVNSYVAKKDLDSEMTVVRNEYERGENSPVNVLLKRVQSVAFDWHNYGHSTIGNRSDIENVKIENLQAYYHQYYQPDNAVLTVAGKFDSAKVLQWIDASFGKIPKPKRVLPTFWTAEPTQDGERNFTVRRQGDIQVLAIAYKIPADLHPDNDAVGLAAQILIEKPSGRLYKQFVETGKVAAVFNTSLGNVAPGLEVLMAVVKKGEAIEPVRDAMIAAIEDFSKNPPTQEELERVKRLNSNAIEKTLNDPEKVGLMMSEIVPVGDWRYLFLDRDKQAAISSEQIAQAAQKYFRRDNRTVGIFIPEDAPQRAEITAAPGIAEVMKDFKPKVQTSVAESFDPSPANIDKRTEISQIGGIKLALLNKKTKGDMVSVSFKPHWGDETSLFGKKWIASLCDALLTSGTSKYTRAQLADEMAKLKMSGGLYSFTTTKENLAAALQLQAHVLKDANFPENEFTQLRDQSIVGMEASRNEPGAVAYNALGAHFNRWPQGDYRSFSGLDESIAGIKAVTLEQVKAFHQQFYGASNAELSIVGNLDAAPIKDVVRQVFGDWKSPAPYARLGQHYDDIPAVRKVLNTPEKASANYLAGLNLPLRDSDADYPALVVANYLFGGGAGMNSRLMERVRQQDGLSYGVGSQLNAGVEDDDGGFTIEGTAAPEKMAQMEKAIKEVLLNTLKDGFTAEELARAKSGILQKRLQSRTTDAGLAAGWTSSLYHQRTYAWAQALDEKIQNLTLEQVNTAFRKAIDPAKLSIFIAVDENKAK